MEDMVSLYDLNAPRVDDNVNPIVSALSVSIKAT